MAAFVRLFAQKVTAKICPVELLVMFILHLALPYRATAFALCFKKASRFLMPFISATCCKPDVLQGLLTSLEPWATQVLRLYRTKILNRIINLDTKQNFEQNDILALNNGKGCLPFDELL